MGSNLKDVTSNYDEITWSNVTSKDPQIRESIAVYGTSEMRKELIINDEDNIFVLRAIAEYGDDQDRLKILSISSDPIVLEAAQTYGGDLVDEWIKVIG